RKGHAVAPLPVVPDGIGEKAGQTRGNRGRQDENRMGVSDTELRIAALQTGQGPAFGLRNFGHGSHPFGPDRRYVEILPDDDGPEGRERRPKPILMYNFNKSNIIDYK